MLVSFTGPSGSSGALRAALADAASAVGCFAAAGGALPAATSTSLSVIRPKGPEPTTDCSAMPLDFAAFFAAGDAITVPAGAVQPAGTGAGAAELERRLGDAAAASTSLPRRRHRFPCFSGGRASIEARKSPRILGGQEHALAVYVVGVRHATDQAKRGCISDIDRDHEEDPGGEARQDPASPRHPLPNT